MPLGSTRCKTVDVRIIAATRRAVSQERGQGQGQGYGREDEIEQQESQREAVAADAPQAVPLVRHDGPPLQTVPDAQGDDGAERATRSDGEPAAS